MDWPLLGQRQTLDLSHGASLTGQQERLERSTKVTQKPAALAARSCLRYRVNSK